ncbi:MAG: SPASM domain-containing protein [Bacteroidia bacterium]|nr:SPASM domain-containing protein [Bacteroidia bacterium]
MLRYFTFSRFWNAVLLYCSYHWSRWSGKSAHAGKAISVTIEPTTSCNLRCPECPSGLRSFTRATGMMKMELFRMIADEVSSHAAYMNFYFQGEPFLHPEITQMFAYASSKKLYTSTSTNAHFLDEKKAREVVQSGLNRLIISIDGTTQDVYESYRIGGTLSKVIEGTRNVVNAKRQLKSATPQIVFQFLVVRPNEHQVNEVKALADELGVDEVVYKSAQVYDYENGNPLIPQNDAYSRYKKNASGKWVLKNKMENQCWRMWHSCVITWDGYIVPCCFDKDAKYKLGSLNEQPLSVIWNNEAYQNFRAQLLRGRNQIDICTNCSEGTKVGLEVE